MRTGNVKRDARRTGPGQRGHLQVANVRVKRGDVEVAAALRKADLCPELVVPERLAVERRVAPVGRDIVPGAERDVQRIIDAAEPETLRRLRVQLHVIAHVVGEEDARQHAVVVRLSGAVGRLVGQTVAIRERAAEIKVPLLLKVVVAQSDGRVEPVGDVPATLGEERHLLEVVRDA